VAIRKYDLDWPDKSDPLQIELAMIRRLYFTPDKTQLLQHYLNAHKLLWNEDEQHRWFLLGMKAIVENKVSIFLGCASSGKTYMMSCHALIDFWVFPETSLGMISSTDIRSLELRIWGRGVKNLFNRAKRKYSWLAGYVLESKMAIVSKDVDEEGEFARLIDHGIVCIPCVSGGTFVGMSKFQGVKPPNSPGKNDGILKSYNDELAVMKPSILDGFSNWMSNENFKGVGAANPTDISDPACIASEPIGGWDTFVDSEKTQTWRSRWHDAFCVAFDGRDTPNNDDPPNRFKFLARSDFVDSLIKTYGADSWQLYQQGIGKPSKGMVSNRVVTIGFCEKHKAFDHVVWRSSPTIRIGALDPAYGGGDRCVWMEGDIGLDVDGRQILSPRDPEIVPIKLNGGVEAEDQIAAFVYNKHKSGIPAENIFWDSFGKGVMGFHFAKLFGANCPIPVDSGGRATDRPVRFDLFVKEGNTKRLMKCFEYYGKFITEVWFSTREAIHSGQVKNLNRAVAEEGQLRLFKTIAGNRVDVEPKDEMKERIKKSPDLYDTFAVLVEGARQRGFRITRIGSEVDTPETDKFAWFRDRQRLLREKRSASALDFSA
jgi:hypothetical protein